MNYFNNNQNGFQQPVMQQPMNGMQQPVMQQPGMGMTQPGMQQPMNGMQQPGMGMMQPGMQQSVNGMQQNNPQALLQQIQAGLESSKDANMALSMMTIIIKECIDSNRVLNIGASNGNGIQFHRQLITIGGGVAFELTMKQLVNIGAIQTDSVLLRKLSSSLVTKIGITQEIDRMVQRVLGGTDSLIQLYQQNANNPALVNMVRMNQCYVVIDDIIIVSLLLDPSGQSITVNTDLAPHIKHKIKNDAKLR